MLKQKLQKLRKFIFSRYETYRLKDVQFIIISNNCWGYDVYHSVKREYNTPFIGLFMFPECYLQLLENFNILINSELKFLSKSKYYDQQKHYPIGILGNTVELHFLHYKSEEEALEKWTRRNKRMQDAIKNHIPLYIKLCDSEACSPSQLARFHNLPFDNKLSIGLQTFPSPNHLHVPNLVDKRKKLLIDGAKLFNKRYRYFDITEWILNSKLVRTPAAKLLGMLS